jgi:transcription elongation factor Elf1
MIVDSYCPECNDRFALEVTGDTKQIDHQCPCGVRIRLTVENGTARVNVLGEWTKQIETKPATKISRKAATK